MESKQRDIDAELREAKRLRRFATPEIYFHPAVQWDTRARSRAGVVMVGVTCPHCHVQRFMTEKFLFNTAYSRQVFTGRCMPCSFRLGKPRGPRTRR